LGSCVPPWFDGRHDSTLGHEAWIGISPSGLERRFAGWLAASGDGCLPACESRSCGGNRSRGRGPLPILDAPSSSACSYTHSRDMRSRCATSCASSQAVAVYAWGMIRSALMASTTRSTMTSLRRSASSSINVESSWKAWGSPISRNVKQDAGRLNRTAGRVGTSR